MHAPLQAICPPGQAHVPLVHTASVPTLALQSAPVVPPPVPHKPVAPQCVSSVAGSMQTPPQLTCVPGQVTAHEEPTQTLPVDAQLVPAVPPLHAPVAPQ
jgi:hypothetical protein